MGRHRRARPLRRRTETRPERRTVVVFCEGEASEPDYVKEWKRLPEVRSRTALDLQVDPRQGVPLTLVRLAIQRLDDEEVDECWCVFDVEWPRNHPHLQQAIRLAGQHGVRTAVSNPCFELWLLLHHQDQTAFLDTATAEQRSRRWEGRAGKRIDATRYLPSRRLAVRRARELQLRHAENGTAFPRDNPSSSFCDLVLAVEPDLLER